MNSKNKNSTSKKEQIEFNVSWEPRGSFFENYRRGGNDKSPETKKLHQLFQKLEVDGQSAKVPYKHEKQLNRFRSIAYSYNGNELESTPYMIRTKQCKGNFLSFVKDYRNEHKPADQANEQPASETEQYQPEPAHH